MAKNNNPAVRKKKASPQKKQNGTIVQSSSWEGPLPPPSLFEHYNDVLPGSAERILKLTELEQSHRHDLEMAELKANVSLAKDDNRQIYFGQILAFLITVSFIGVGGFLAYSGKQLSGTMFAGIGIVGIVTAFLKRKK